MVHAHLAHVWPVFPVPHSSSVHVIVHKLDVIIILLRALSHGLQ